jgi:signal transduction histidine kinase/DNA-binding response OmpR family regulator
MTKMTENDGVVNILIVDDLRDKLMALEAILHAPGQAVVTARSGREALRRLLERDFAVILLDVNMPEMDGFETAAMIRQRKQNAHTPIIFITAFNDDEYTARGYSLGAVDYIYSPVVPEILRTKVGVFVDLYRKTEQIRRQADERVALAREQTARLAAEEGTRRASLLAEITSTLARSLEHETTVRDFLRLVVPHLADLAGITLVSEPGQPWQNDLAWVFPPAADVQTLSITSPDGPGVLWGSSLPHSPAEDDLRTALERVLASCKAEILDGLKVAFLPRVSTGDVPPEVPGQLHSAALLPLRARGRTLGALVLGLSEADRRFAPADLGYAEDLAGRAAIAIDNARLYREVQDADRRKNEFLAMLAHELRNPLAPIRSAVQILRRIGSTDPQARWSQDVIERQVQQMSRLVDDMLDVSRITRGQIVLQMEPVELSDVVSRAVETSHPLIDQRRHELSVALPRERLRVEADLVRLSQVVANLLNNAAKYTAEGGLIWLTAEREGSEAVVRVRDSGMGIPGNMLSNIFDLFTQVDRSLERTQGGLGIGLTLVRTLVEMHGGTVQALSAGSNRGSEFVVRLPALVEAPLTQTIATRAANDPKPCVPRRVLVVDDNVDGAESLAMVLRLCGHDVCCAHDGPAGLEMAEAFRPDVLLLDIGLPKMDGYEVARELRRRPELADVFLVALTGYGSDDDRRRTEEAGFDVHLVKPVDLDALPRLLANALKH